MLETSDRPVARPVAPDEDFRVRWLRAGPAVDRRRDRLSAAIFTGVNVVVFMILLGCLLAASLLYNRWH